MNTKHTFKSKKESVSHNFQESNKVFNKNGIGTTTALVIANHKERYQEKTDNSKKQAGLNCPLIFSKDTAPRLQVSIDFAASQWFQILLIHINSKNKNLGGVLEPIPGGLLRVTG